MEGSVEAATKDGSTALDYNVPLLPEFERRRLVPLPRQRGHVARDHGLFRRTRGASSHQQVSVHPVGGPGTERQRAGVARFHFNLTRILHQRACVTRRAPIAVPMIAGQTVLIRVAVEEYPSFYSAPTRPAPPRSSAFRSYPRRVRRPAHGSSWQRSRAWLGGEVATVTLRVAAAVAGMIAATTACSRTSPSDPGFARAASIDRTSSRVSPSPASPSPIPAATR